MIFHLWNFHRMRGIRR